jgi:hypothetical protein
MVKYVKVNEQTGIALEHLRIFIVYWIFPAFELKKKKTFHVI